MACSGDVSCHVLRGHQSARRLLVGIHLLHPRHPSSLPTTSLSLILIPILSHLHCLNISSCLYILVILNVIQFFLSTTFSSSMYFSLKSFSLNIALSLSFFLIFHNVVLPHLPKLSFFLIFHIVSLRSLLFRIIHYTILSFRKIIHVIYIHHCHYVHPHYLFPPFLVSKFLLFIVPLPHNCCYANT